MGLPQESDSSLPSLLASTIQLDMRRKQSATQKADTLLDTSNLCRLEFEPQFIGHEKLALVLDSLQLLPIFSPEQHIVHVPDVTAHTQGLLYMTIKPAKVEVGKVLRHQTANRQSYSLGTTKRSHNLFKQTQEPRLFKPTGQQLNQ
jgi:hypothetical protein